MKITTFFLAALLCSVYAFGQYSAADYKDKDYAKFKASKTYYVKTGNESFDTEVINVLKEQWKETPYEVIDDAAFKTKLPDPANSFILSLIIGTQYANQNYHYLALVNGGKKKLNNYGYDDMLAYSPINHWVDETDNAACAFRVRNMIESMIAAMDLVQKNDIRGNSKKIVEGLQEVYNAKAGKIKKRTLLFCKESMGAKFKPEDVAGNYPYKYEICTKEKLAKVIKEKSKEYYYFQPGITLNKNMFVFDPSNGEVVYCDMQIQGLNIDKKNIKELVETIDK
jgi:hypothetical protein